MSMGTGRSFGGLRVAALGIVVMAVVVLGSMTALADHVEPEFQPDNPTCGDFGEDLIEFKVEPVTEGEHSDGTLTVTLTIDEDAKTFDWESNIGVDSVVVKGGDNANLYIYDPPAEETSDTGLHAPLNESSPEEGDFYGLSHVSFCYDVESSPSPSPSPSETPSESPSPTVSPTETETSTPTPAPSTPGTTVAPTTAQTSPSVLGTKVLSRTGADVRSLALMGLMMLGLGVLAYTVARRSGKAR